MATPSPSAGHEALSEGDGGEAVAAQKDTASAISNPDSGAGPLEGPPKVPKVVHTNADVFMLARQQNFTVLVKILKDFPDLWRGRDEDGHSLMHWASLVGNLDFVKDALNQDLPVDAAATNEQTPLMWACLRGHTPVARVLLDAKANISWQDSLGATPLMISLQHQQYGCALLLVHRGDKAKLMSDCDKNGCTSAHWAAYKGDLMALRLADYFDADLHKADNAGMQPLHRAASQFHVPVIKFLVEKDADLTATNRDGKTCLQIAEANNDIHMQSVLKHLEKGQKQKKEASKSGNLVQDIESGMPADPKQGDKAKKQGMLAVARSEGMQGIFKDKQMHIVFPLFWLVCVSMATFEYIVDMRQAAYVAIPRAALAFELGVPLSLLAFARTALGDPGKLAARVKGNSAVEELMRKLDTVGATSLDLSRLCTTTWVLKDLRTKYCAQTGACVEEFDHYCIWLNCAIGKKNHRPFIVLALLEFLTQVAFIVAAFYVSRELVPVQSYTGWPIQVLLSYPLLTIITILHCLTAPWVLMLLLHQLRLVATNMTTNEMMNAHRYEHFWITNGMTKAFRNPFDKGGKVRNCLDFFWYKNRGLKGPAANQPMLFGHRHGPQCQHGGHNHRRG